MKALIVSDIHSNLEAFQAVLADCGTFDAIWCLGDTVGYGPDPVPCIKLLRQYPHICVAGNHDHAAVGLISTEMFNYAAAAAAHWTETQLLQEHKEFLISLPTVTQEGPFTLVHGSLRSPLWEYLLSPDTAKATLGLLTTPICLVGHSHLPFICVEEEDGPRFSHFSEGQPVALGAKRLIINPGGVGQPRDGDPRSAYALYDSESGSLEHRRVSYDIPLTQEKMGQAGLPLPLINRLSHGH